MAYSLKKWYSFSRVYRIGFGASALNSGDASYKAKGAQASPHFAPIPPEFCKLK